MYIMQYKDDLWTCGKKWPIIYSDPPWYFKAYDDKTSSRGAHFHYKIMSNEDIKKLPIGDLAESNSLMFQWCTKPLFPIQISIMEYFGFKYITIGFTWIKLNKKNGNPFKGLGYYTRANPEWVIIGKKGKGLGRPKNKSIDEVIMSPIREHSRKPDIVHDNIMQMYDGPYLELFGRTEYPGWDVYGNETNKFKEENTNIFNEFGE